MDHVHDNLYVGDVNDADNPQQLENNDVEYILNVSGTSTESDTAPGYDIVKERNYVHFPLADDGSNPDFMLRTAIETGRKMMKHAERNGTALLVHCSVGASRSVAIAAALMSLENERVVRENISRIKKTRTIANPHDELAGQVSRITADIHSEG